MRYVGAFFVLALLITLTVWLRDDAPTATGPNVVIISIDSLRADHMSLYGYERPTTPNIDAYAQGAIVFENYFSTSYLTPISESSVHTGTYPLKSGMINFETPVRKDVPMLAEILSTEGWGTAAYGSSLEFQYYPAVRESFSRGFGTYAINSDYFDLPWRGRGTVRAESAMAWAQNRVEKEEPFFLWVTVGSAHWPYGEDEAHHFSDASYDGPFGDSGPFSGSSLNQLFNEKYGLAYKGVLYDKSGAVVDSDIREDIAYVRDRYDDGLVMTDRKIAGLLGFLARPDIAANTIVIIQSEHGEGFGEHGYVAHYDIMDTQTHTPLIVRAPGFAPARVEALASGVDIVPTLLDMLGMQDRVSVDGVSLVPLMKDAGAEPPRSEVFITRTSLWERAIAFYTPWLEPFVESDDRAPHYDTAIRTDRWMLVHRLSRDAQRMYSWWGKLTGEPVVLDEYELYDMRTDKAQSRSVYHVYQAQTEVRELRDRLSAWEAEMRGGDIPQKPREQVQPYF